MEQPERAARSIYAFIGSQKMYTQAIQIPICTDGSPNNRSQVELIEGIGRLD